MQVNEPTLAIFFNCRLRLQGGRSIQVYFWTVNRQDVKFGRKAQMVTEFSACERH